MFQFRAINFRAPLLIAGQKGFFTGQYLSSQSVVKFTMLFFNASQLDAVENKPALDFREQFNGSVHVFPGIPIFHLLSNSNKKNIPTQKKSTLFCITKPNSKLQTFQIINKKRIKTVRIIKKERIERCDE